MRHGRWIAGVLGAASLVAGCELGKTCTLMYAPDQLTFELERSAWEAGEWSFEADGAGCVVVLPAAGPEDVVCDEGYGLELTEDGLEPSTLSVTDHAPDSLEVSVGYDGVEVLTTVVEPEYTESEPNGEGCGVTRSATVTLTIPES